MKCLRCGRDATQGSFCESCRPTVQEPLRESSYLHTRIVLPTRKEQPIVKKPEPKKERKRRPWGLIFSTALLSLLCAALLLQGAFYAYGKAQLQMELDKAVSEASEDHAAVEFLRKQVVFIQKEETRRYHQHDCPLFMKQSYWAYTLRQAEDLGFEPCPVCQ